MNCSMNKNSSSSSYIVAGDTASKQTPEIRGEATLKMTMMKSILADKSRPEQVNWPALFIYSMASLVGVPSNLLIILSIIKSKSLRSNPTFLLILNQTMADFLICLVVNSHNAVGAWVEDSFFVERPVLCESIAVICMIACSASLISMSFLALNRLVVIVYHPNKKNLFNRRQTNLCCAFIWLAGVLVELLNFTEYGEHVFDHQLRSCLFNRLKLFYTCLFLIVCVLIPSLVIAYCYARIFLFAERAKLKVARNRLLSATSNRVHSLRMARGMLVSFVLFSVCWLPMCFVDMIGFQTALPDQFHFFANLVAHVNSALNPFVSVLFNTRLRANLFLISSNKYRHAGG
nr:G protein-coupled receptor [Proales similis]